MSGTLRGLFIVLAIVFGPFLVGAAVTPVALGLGANGAANVAFSVVLLSVFLVLPQLSMVPPLPTGWPLSLALVEWILVGLVVGRLTAGRRLGQTLIVAFALVLVVAGATQFLIRVLGYTVIVEGP